MGSLETLHVKRHNKEKSGGEEGVGKQKVDEMKNKADDGKRERRMQMMYSKRMGLLDL